MRTRPTAVPSRVSINCVCRLVASGSAFASTTLASPKSSTFTNPSSLIMTFVGFKSRWTMPARWARPTASAICVAISRTCSTPIRPRESSAASVSPSTNSIAMKSTAPTELIS